MQEKTKLSTPSLFLLETEKQASDPDPTIGRTFLFYFHTQRNLKLNLSKNAKLIYFKFIQGLVYVLQCKPF